MSRNMKILFKKLSGFKFSIFFTSESQRFVFAGYDFFLLQIFASSLRVHSNSKMKKSLQFVHEAIGVYEVFDANEAYAILHATR